MGKQKTVHRFCSSEELQEFLHKSGSRIIISVWTKHGKRVELDDFLQLSHLCIAEALTRFDPMRVDVKTETYIYHCVENVYKMMVRREYAQKVIPRRNCYSYEVLCDMEADRASEQMEELRPTKIVSRAKNQEGLLYEENISLQDVCSEVEEDKIQDEVIANERRALLWKAMRAARLTADEMAIIQGTLKGVPQKEIGKKIGISQAAVSKRLAIATLKIKKALSSICVLA